MSEATTTFSGVLILALGLFLGACSNSSDETADADDGRFTPIPPSASVGEAVPEPAPAEEPVPEEPPAEAAADGQDQGAAPSVGLLNASLEDILYLELACGQVEIQMRPDLAPGHVERIKELVRDGFYDGLVFHRVIDGFMAQTGDPTGTGMGASPLPDIPAEFSDVLFDRGIVGMARRNPVDSANSQFFIMFAREPALDGRYTVWGEVTDGMDCVDQIERGEPPADPDVIISARIASDI